MPEEGEGGGAEGALGRIDLQTCVLQDFEDQAEVPHVFGEVLAGDQDVVEVYEHEWKMAKEFVHETLKRLRSIFEAKRHKNVFEKTEWRANCRFRYVTLCHWHLMIAFDQIYF